jgi:proton-dependent oligopeptide transporter, POT family
MAKPEYLTAPVPSEKMPGGIPYILANEGAERFAFYGMSSILVVFMTKYLMGANGALAVMTDDKAKEWFHLFTAAVYFTPLIGALISDVWLGKYRTIVLFSVLYCVGFATLAWDQTRLGLGAGLILIALGSGIIKPCVSANVGDQFGQRNKHLVSKMYSWFYFSINVGACISMLVCPWLLDKYGPRIGFGVPAALMVFATVAFVLGKRKYVHIPPVGKMSIWFYLAIMGVCIVWLRPWLLAEFGPRVGYTVTGAVMGFATVAFIMGRQKYVHIPPVGKKILAEKIPGNLLDRVVSKFWELLKILLILGRLCVIYVFVAMFFALFYQSQGAWILQAENMNLKWLGITWLPAQVQFANSLFLLPMIPLFTYVLYPAISRVFPLTPLRKIGLGMFVTAACFIVPAWVEIQIGKGAKPSIGWQFFAYIILTAGEILASIAVLEFSYTQAPKKVKTFVMSLYLLSISLGNLFAWAVNHFIQNADGSSKLPGASYYWFFAIAMLVTLVFYIPVAMRFPVQEHIQDEAEEGAAS